jgi:hypothetical protein
MSLTRCCNFVQRTTHEAVAKHRIDGGNTKGQGPWSLLEPGRSLQSQKALTQLRDHRQAFEDIKYSAQSVGTACLLCSCFVLMWSNDQATSSRKGMG